MKLKGSDRPSADPAFQKSYDLFLLTAQVVGKLPLDLLCSKYGTICCIPNTPYLLFGEPKSERHWHHSQKCVLTHASCWQTPDTDSGLLTDMITP